MRPRNARCYRKPSIGLPDRRCRRSYKLGPSASTRPHCRLLVQHRTHIDPEDSRLVPVSRNRRLTPAVPHREDRKSNNHRNRRSPDSDPAAERMAVRSRNNRHMRGSHTNKAANPTTGRTNTGPMPNPVPTNLAKASPNPIPNLSRNQIPNQNRNPSIRQSHVRSLGRILPQIHGCRSPFRDRRESLSQTNESCRPP